MTLRSFSAAISIFCILLVTGCSTSRDLPYFINIPDTGTGIIDQLPVNDVTIQPDDELLITVNSIDPMATAAYNLPLVNPTVSEVAKKSQTTPQQQTYLVNSAGDINFPVLGKIRVKGMTIEELTAYLTERISEKVIDPIVYVSLVNFSVTVIGDVNEPQKIDVTKPHTTILDVIGASGDLTPYGRRDNVLVIRAEDGKRVYQRLNLQDASIMESPYFYVHQNDIIYIEPNQIAQANSKYNTNNAYKLSVVTAIVSALSVITSVIIALSR